MDWRSIPSLSALRAFEATSRLRSFSKAAQELNVTHAAIAQHVRALEAEFGEQFVYRQGRGLALTDKGTQFSQSLRTGFAEIELAVSDLRAHSDNRPLNITVTPTLASHWLMPRMGDFWKKYPDISININPSIEVVDLARDGYDLGIRYCREPGKNLISEKLLCGDYCVVGQKDFLEKRNICCLSDLTDETWFFEHSNHRYFNMLASEGVDVEGANVKTFVTNELALAATSAGSGLSIQPIALVQEQITDGSLTSLYSLDESNLFYYMVVPKNRQHKHLAVFQKWLRSMAA